LPAQATRFQGGLLALPAVKKLRRRGSIVGAADATLDEKVRGARIVIVDWAGHSPRVDKPNQ
jgi:hypothetical protein